MAEFTGERVIPGQVDPDLFNEHLARYAFAGRMAAGKRVLDAGCGAGYGSAEMAQYALSVVGADQSAEALEYAREHFPLPNVRFEQASCTALPHPEGAFDLVAAFEVIEHLSEWRDFLLEVRRVLAPGGQFLVSTPNKLYYAESRESSGPNPFHVHEFEFAEFRDALLAVFPHVSMFLENHAGAVVFQPVEAGSHAETRVEGGGAVAEESHFFLALCSLEPLVANTSFVYVPKTANVLRERERHIALLEGYLQKATREHQDLLAMFHAQKAELEERNQWAQEVDRESRARGERILQLQEELRTQTESYEAKIAELEQENQAKTEWAVETDRQLREKCEELAHCVDYLHQVEKTLDERTAWAEQLSTRVHELDRLLAFVKASRWVQMGRKVGLGPELPN